MKRYFIDTCIFIRIFTKDKPELTEACLNLLKSLEQEELCTNVLVLAEIIWVLKSFYKKSYKVIISFIREIESNKKLKIFEAIDNAVVLRALELSCKNNMDFTDAYNIIWLKQKGIKNVVTLDTTHFQRVQGIKIIKPSL